MPAQSLEQVRNLCMRRGFVFPGSAAYGGLGSFWDYGPLGVEMLNNIKQAWWHDAVYARNDMEGVDAAILMSRKVWQHSGHEATFSDPLVDNKKNGKRYRLDHLLEAQTQEVVKTLFDDLLRSIVRAGARVDSRIQEEFGEPQVSAQWLSRVLATDAVLLAPPTKQVRHPEQNAPHDATFYKVAKDGSVTVRFLTSDTTSEPGTVRTNARVIEELPLLEALKRQPEEFIQSFRQDLQSYPAFVRSQDDGTLESLARIMGRYIIEQHYRADLLNAAKVVDPDVGKVGDWTAPRSFNLMFESHVGPVSAKAGTDEEKAARVYMRPETAQGIFMNFAHVQRSMARKVPFGIAQIGKAFRNEITPGNFIFRTREFEQMEIEFFIKPEQYVQEGDKTDEQWHEEWIDQRFRWWLKLATPPTAGNAEMEEIEERFRKRAQTADELAHYAKATTDIEYLFPGALGWGEIEGVANRTDFDLTAHSKDIPDEDLQRLKLEDNKDSNEKFDYFDPDAKARYVPWVIEPSAGVTRAMLTFLCEAYDEELVKEPTKQEVDQIKSDAAQIKNNAEKKIKQAEKDLAAGKEAKHDPVQVRAFLDKLEDVVARLPESLGEVLVTLDHPGAADLEPVKKFRPPTEKFMEDISRTVLRLHPALAPIKLAVFPLKKNKPEIVELAKSIKQKFQKHFRTVYDDSAGIGRLYRRQDEIGTPYCITVDFESLEDGTVTVRERDTMSQERVAIDQLEAYILPHVRLE